MQKEITQNAPLLTKDGRTSRILPAYKVIYGNFQEIMGNILLYYPFHKILFYNTLHAFTTRTSNQAD